MTENERLKAQLKLAMSALEAYAKRENWRNTYSNAVDWCPVATENKWKSERGYQLAEKKIKQIKELNR